MALDIYKQAKRDGQNAAAMTAVKEIGILTGIRIERRESGAPGEFAEIEKMTAEELEAFIAGELEAYRRLQSRKDSFFELRGCAEDCRALWCEPGNGAEG
jgi:hypothetical protein